jgi:hypothetical protein
MRYITIIRMAFGSPPPQQTAHQVAWVSVAGPAEIAGFLVVFG